MGRPGQQRFAPAADRAPWPRAGPRQHTPIPRPRSRGFAFVEMENEGEADQAINALNGYSLDGRALNVNEARPKRERSFGGGAGGGGGRPFGGGGGGGGRGAGRPGGGGGGRREP